MTFIFVYGALVLYITSINTKPVFDTLTVSLKGSPIHVKDLGKRRKGVLIDMFNPT